jgi:hypothetical protein
MSELIVFKVASAALPAPTPTPTPPPRPTPPTSGLRVPQMPTPATQQAANATPVESRPRDASGWNTQDTTKPWISDPSKITYDMNRQNVLAGRGGLINSRPSRPQVVRPRPPVNSTANQPLPAAPPVQPQPQPAAPKPAPTPAVKPVTAPAISPAAAPKPPQPIKPVQPQPQAAASQPQPTAVTPPATAPQATPTKPTAMPSPANPQYTTSTSGGVPFSVPARAEPAATPPANPRTTVGTSGGVPFYIPGAADQGLLDTEGKPTGNNPNVAANQTMPGFSGEKRSMFKQALPPGVEPIGTTPSAPGAGVRPIGTGTAAPGDFARMGGPGHAPWPKLGPPEPATQSAAFSGNPNIAPAGLPWSPRTPAAPATVRPGVDRLQLGLGLGTGIATNAAIQNANTLLRSTPEAMQGPARSWGMLGRQALRSVNPAALAQTARAAGPAGIARGAMAAGGRGLGYLAGGPIGLALLGAEQAGNGLNALDQKGYMPSWLGGHALDAPEGVDPSRTISRDARQEMYISPNHQGSYGQAALHALNPAHAGYNVRGLLRSPWDAGTALGENLHAGIRSDGLDIQTRGQADAAHGQSLRAAEADSAATGSGFNPSLIKERQRLAEQKERGNMGFFERLFA